jgi:hypothetical protein
MAKRKTPRPVGMIMSIFHSAEKLRRENSALRKILRKHGVTDVAIRRLLIASKKLDPEEEMSESFLRKCCEEFLKRLNAMDVERELGSLPEETPPSLTN